MAGVSVRVDVRDKAVKAALTSAQDLDLGPLKEEIGEFAVSQVQMHFQDSRGADGTPWVPSQRAQRTGGKTLIDQAILSGSINYQLEGDDIVVGPGDAARAYAAIHQFGGNAGPNLSVSLPARPYNDLSEDDEEEINLMLEEYVLERLDG